MMTDKEQLDILWRALANPEFWFGVDRQGSALICHTDGAKIGSVSVTLHGSRETIIAQLLAREVADRLEGKPALPDIVPEPRTEFDLPSWTPADRNRGNRSL